MALFLRTGGKCATRITRGNHFYIPARLALSPRMLPCLETTLLHVLQLSRASQNDHSECFLAARNPCLGEGEDRCHLGGGTCCQPDFHQRGIGGAPPSDE